MATTAAPHEGMAMSVPVGRGFFDRTAELLPGFKATTFERQGAQDLPPSFKKIEVRSVFGLKALLIG
jgi:hypothetical protein